MADDFFQINEHILDINEENSKEKLRTYFDHVLKRVEQLGARDITITTRIKEMSSREFKVQSVIQQRLDKDWSD